MLGEESKQRRSERDLGYIDKSLLEVHAKKRLSARDKSKQRRTRARARDEAVGLKRPASLGLGWGASLEQGSIPPPTG